MTIKDLPLAEISIDGGTQARAAIHAPTVTDYADAMTEGEELPPGVVFFDGAKNFLADGFHRYHANRQIGATTMTCDVRTGTLRDARLFAYGANRDHGLRRTNEDKRKAVLGMLADFPEMSDRAIAKHVGVTHPFVGGIRNPEVAARQAETRTSAKSAKVETVSTPADDEPEEEQGASTAPDAAAAGPKASAAQAEVETVSTQPDETAANRITELEQMAAELLADNNAMSAVLDADDKLATTLADNKRLRAEVGGLRERINGLMAEKNEAIRLMKSWRSKFEKADKAAKARAE